MSEDARFDETQQSIAVWGLLISAVALVYTVWPSQPPKPKGSGIGLQEASIIGGGYFGYTPASAANPLIQHKVNNIFATSTREMLIAEPFNHICVETNLGLNDDRTQPMIIGFRAEVSRFEPLAEYVNEASQLGLAPAIEVAFYLSKQQENPTKHKPWVFEPLLVAVSRNELGERVEPSYKPPEDMLPIPFADYSPATLKVWFAAGDPGIYWVNFFVEGENPGIKGSQQDIPLFERAIPIAFFDADAQLNGAAYMKKLKEVQNSDEWIEIGK